MDEPLPWDAKAVTARTRTRTAAELEAEGQTFMAAMQALKG